MRLGTALLGACGGQARHSLAQKEVFGPVLCAMPFTGEAHAIELANATQFGLVAGMWTHDGARQFRMAKKRRCGQVFINNYGAGVALNLLIRPYEL